MDEHTPEPWICQPNDDGVWRIRPKAWMRWAWIATAQAETADIPHDEANARRIVACVNALRGVPIDALESGVFRDKLKRLGLVEMGDG